VQIPFSIKFSSNRKLKGYELQAIPNLQNVVGYFRAPESEKKTNYNDENI
jgi:hypothetical protein